MLPHSNNEMQFKMESEMIVSVRRSFSWMIEGKKKRLKVSPQV